MVSRENRDRVLDDRDAGAMAGWGRSLTAVVGTFLISALLLLTLILLVDPYDRGYFGLLGVIGVDDRTVTGNASRGRDLGFNSAILTNSTGQFIEPSSLSAATGKRFVQLLVPGGRPEGLLSVSSYFLRDHEYIDTLVIVIDTPWCAHGAARDPNDDFPYWLFEDSMLSYAAHLWNWRTIGRLVQRLQIDVGIRKPMRADGYWSYEEVWLSNRRPAPNGANDEREIDQSAKTEFPYKDRLALMIRKLPAKSSIVLVVPPVFFTGLPQPQSRAAAERVRCNESFRELVNGRVGSTFINYRLDDAFTRDPDNFVDVVHYRAKIAERISKEIAASLNAGASRSLELQ